MGPLQNMSPLQIGNTHRFPLDNIDGNLVNKYSTNFISAGSTTIPNGPHTIPVVVGGRKNKKISRYNKMSRTRRHRKYRRTRNRRARRSRRYHMKGGMPNYPLGHSQYLNNNGGMSNTYSLGGQLSAANSAMANPPIFNRVAGQPDNYSRFTNTGFPSRGWH
jgi:hypothetical protein